MQKRLLPIALIGFVVLIAVTWSCTKLDTTTLGSDLIPAVDNVNTFRDSFNVNSVTGNFVDSTKVLPTDNHALGFVSNDPLFGTLEANVFMQLKPGFFPYYLGTSSLDTIQPYNPAVDSVVLCLSYKGSWGDTTVDQRLEVFDVTDTAFNNNVLIYQKTSFAPTVGESLGAANVRIGTLSQQIKFNRGKDSTSNQIRIKLTNSAYVQALLARDSSATNAFRSDSLFRKFYKGIAVKAMNNGSKSLMYVNLADANTRLEVYFRKSRQGVKDTTYTTFSLFPNYNSTYNIYPSGTVNNIVRNNSGTPSATPDVNAHYLQTSNIRTAVNLTIPDLDIFKQTNKIIHRAELIIQQIPDTNSPVSSDSNLSAPPYVYLDLRVNDSVYKPIYTDLNPDVFYDPDNSLAFYPSSLNQNYFGGFVRKRIDPASGRSQVYYNINISRYVQRMLIKKADNLALRLYAPSQINYGQYTPQGITYNNPVAFGRVRIGSGANPNAAYRMRLVITWSKVN